MNITVDKLYQSILARAADVYELEYEDVERDIGLQLDPVVRFLAGACASELERVYQHLHDTEGRLQQRLAKALLPEYYHLPQPAHALATATPSSDPVLIDETTAFEKADAENNKNYAFSPLFPALLLPAKLRLVATDTQLIGLQQRPKSRRGKAGEAKTEMRKILLGIEAQDPITNWQGVTLFFNLRGRGNDESEKALFFAGLSGSFCTLNGMGLNTSAGLPDAHLILEDYLNGNERLQSQVRARYERHFLTFTDPEVPAAVPQAAQEFLPKWFAASITEEEAVKSIMEGVSPELKQPLYWLEVNLSRPVEVAQLSERLSVRLNVFPVVNRRLNGQKNGEHHYLQTNSIKWIPLQPQEDFVSIRRVYEEKPPEYPVFTFKPFADFKEEHKPSYTLRFGGVGRWDDFNAWQRLAYVIAILQENYQHSELIQKAADSLSLEDVHHLLGKKISKTAAEQKPTRDIYVLLHSGITSGMRVRVEYWTSQGAEANGMAAKSPLKCTSKQNASLESNSISLITSTADGRDPLNTTEQLYAMKSALLSRGRIVTREDVKIFCKEFLQDKISKIMVQDGVGTDPRFDFGMTRLLDVILSPSAQASKEDWEGICQQVQTLLEQKSASSIPIRVRLETP